MTNNIAISGNGAKIEGTAQDYAGRRRSKLNNDPARNLSANDLAAAIEVLSSGTIRPSKKDPGSLVLLGVVQGQRWRVVLKSLEEEVFSSRFTKKQRPERIAGGKVARRVVTSLDGPACTVRV